MVKEEQEQHHSSANDSENSGNSSAEEDQENPENVSTTTPTKCTDYELQREARIADNKARMEALGLRNIANSLMGTPQNRRITRSSTPKSKRGVVKKEDDDDDDDDEYEPNDEFVDGDNDDDSEEEEETFVPRNRKSSAKKDKSTKLKSGKQVSKRNTEIPVFMDEDEALKQAIALSLKDHEENSDLQKGGFSQGSNTETPGTSKDKCHYQFQEDRTKRRKRKLFTSRVKMTEDDLVIHFCQIDEAGKGGIKLRDVARMAASHDYNWTDKELSDMIRCFDSDRDGKLTLDDFRNIVQRCNMLLVQDDS